MKNILHCRMISKSYILDNFIVGIGAFLFGIFTLLTQRETVNLFDWKSSNFPLTLNVMQLFIGLAIVLLYWLFTVKGMKRDPMQDTSMKLTDEDKKGYELRMKKELKITDYFTSIALGAMITLGASTNISLSMHTVIGICAMFIGVRLLTVGIVSWKMANTKI